MAKKKKLKFKLTGEEFHEIDPEIKFSNMNAMAFVARIQKDMPDPNFYNLNPANTLT